MIDFAQARRNMVDSQLRTFDVTDRAILAAMGETPRERFVAPGQEAFAYSDGAVEAARGGAELLAPMVLARMIQALSIKAGDRVMDVGGGGYSAAIMERLGARVVTLDAEAAADGAASPGSAARVGRLDQGCPDLAPFDAILVHGAVEEEPAGLLAQLADGGRLACLRRDGRTGRALLYVKAHGATGFRPLFDAAARVLPDFARPPGFVF